MKGKQLIAMGLSAVLVAVTPSIGSTVYAETATEVTAEEKQQKRESTETPKTETPKTEAPTEAPKTEAPTEPPKTEAPTEPPKTETPTEPPKTEAPTEPPKTEAPTETPGSEETEETQKPSESTPETPGETAPGEKETEEATENGAGETDTETGKETESTEDLSESESEVLTEEESESESQTKGDKDGLIEDEEKETEKEEEITNEQLISRQNIVTPPDISLEFRFVQVEKDYAVVKDAMQVNLYEEKAETSKVVGTLKNGGLCYILEDKNSSWVYVESGSVRGFVQRENLVMDEAAEKIVAQVGEDKMALANAAVSSGENEAFAYTHTTVYPVIADKVYGVAKEELQIYEAQSQMARSVGRLNAGGLCYLLADLEEDWIYVESGDARGFVRAEQLLVGLEAIQTVMQNGEMQMALADVEIEPSKNQACYYTVTSTRPASAAALTRSDMVNYSFQFLGNPYVWGGTSLTNGCDCSGFTQSIYAHFGYYIPRVAEAQAVCSMQIPISSAAPGDLIFYAKNGYIYHVSMYIGNGQVIHAAGTNLGIITSGIGSAAVWAVRIITD